MTLGVVRSCPSDVRICIGDKSLRPENTYIEFPATIQAIEWTEHSMGMSSGRRDLSPMQMRTSDGLMVGLGVVAEYHVVQEQIPEIYRHYLQDYETFFINNLRSAFQVLIGGFRATELYTERLKVSQGMFDTCKRVCAENLKVSEGMFETCKR